MYLGAISARSRHVSQIKRELREQPGRLQLLHGIVTDLFVDKYKFKGQSVGPQVTPARSLHSWIDL